MFSEGEKKSQGQQAKLRPVSITNGGNKHPVTKTFFPPSPPSPSVYNSGECKEEFYYD